MINFVGSDSDRRNFLISVEQLRMYTNVLVCQTLSGLIIIQFITSLCGWCASALGSVISTQYENTWQINNICHMLRFGSEYSSRGDLRVPEGRIFRSEPQTHVRFFLHILTYYFILKMIYLNICMEIKVISSITISNNSVWIYNLNSNGEMTSF
jgi:hypothetical protein